MERTLSFTHRGFEDLEDADGECGCFAGTRLCLCNGISALADLDDGPRLDCRGRLISVCVDATQQVLLQMHVLKGWRNRDLLRSRKLHLVCFYVSQLQSGLLLDLPSLFLSMPAMATGCGGVIWARLWVYIEDEKAQAEVANLKSKYGGPHHMSIWATVFPSKCFARQTFEPPLRSTFHMSSSTDLNHLRSPSYSYLFES
jgi:hypothetical protein